jgi:sugar O-acyltransferase (sialic acid O-acetyltransferase NeuD family)
VTSSSRRDLLVIGSGGFGRETVEAVRAINAAGGCWQILGYLDDDPALNGKAVDGVPILGGIAEVHSYPSAHVVVCTGRPDNYLSRPRIVGGLGLSPDRYATIIHPSAAVSSSSKVGPGSVILAQTVLTASVNVGSHVAVMPHVTFTHDDTISDFATVASGVRLGGGVRISEGAYIGSGALVREHRTIGSGALVGMGAVVTHDVPAHEVWAGVPARYVRKQKTDPNYSRLD